MQAEARTMLSEADLQRFMSRDGVRGAGAELMRQIRIMAQKYKSEKGRNEEIMKRLKALHEQSLDKKEAQAKFDKLQRAHVEQAAFLQKLQEENAKVAVYRTTIATQEKVIAQLQTLMENKLQDRLAGVPGPIKLRDEVRKLARRNEEAERKIIAGEAGARIREMRKQLEEAMATANAAAAARGSGGAGQPQQQQQDKGGGEPSGASAEEIKQKNDRIQILEKQMVDNARGFAKEISTLKMKVMELDFAAGGDDF